MIRPAVFGLFVANLLYFGWSMLAIRNDPPLVAVTPGPRQTPPPDTRSTCTTLGPFADEAGLQPVEDALAKAGWGVLRRSTTQQVADGYWVTIDDMQDAGAQSRVIDALVKAGIDDAFAMPENQGLRISVGIFTDQGRAQARAAQVQQLGIDARVSDRMREVDTLWLDVPGVSPSILDDDRLAGMSLVPDAFTVQDCP